MRHPRLMLCAFAAAVLSITGWAGKARTADEVVFRPTLQRQVFKNPDEGSFLITEVPPAPASNGDSDDAGQSKKESTTADSPKSRFNAQVVTAGKAAFQKSCAECHPLSTALNEKKSFAKWRATVWRMAAKSGSDVAPGDRLPIATYLASLSAPAEKPSTAAKTPTSAPTTALTATEGEASSQAFSIQGTLSPLWRGGGNHLQHPGFFPQAWLGVDWQSDSPLSGRATACIACHDPGTGDHFVLVEAALRLDLVHMFLMHEYGHERAVAMQPNVRASVEAGRFIVPFGAFAAQNNPGVYRTVSRPLIFNMGQRIYDPDIGDPVLPMPYSDEGADVKVALPVFDSEATLTVEGYLVNGLQGGIDGIDFDDSRDYLDNNSSPSVGGRVTLGNQLIRAGTSVINGRFNPNGGSPLFAGRLNYTIFGADISLHYKDILRVQAEYARRGSDRAIPMPGSPLLREHVEGLYVEGELMLCNRMPKVSILARYDVQDRGSHAPVPESVLASGTFRVSRFTWGFNILLPHGSMLMINHEHWFVPTGLADVDILGVRWSAMF